MNRFLLSAALLASLGALSAQTPTYYSSTALGYEVAQSDLTTAAPSSFEVNGGAAWDPSGSDLYYWDVTNHQVRRFDTTLAQPATAALFDVPAGGFGTYLDAMAFDPANPNDLYLIESVNQVIYKVRRLTLDTLDTSFGTGGVQTSATLSFFLYDIKFDPAGRLMTTGANSLGTPVAGVFVVDTATLATTQIVDLLGPGGTDTSGPLAFNEAGDLFVALPADFGTTDPMRIVRFSRAQVDAAVASGGATPLTIAEAQVVIGVQDAFPNSGGMDFRTEGGKEILYLLANDGSLYRSDLATRAYALFAQADNAPVGEDHFSSALAIESRTADFRPYSGDPVRIATMMGTRDIMTGDHLFHAVCIVTPAASPGGGIAGLVVTDSPTIIRNGEPFRLAVEFRDGANQLMGTTNGSVSVQIASGSGSLSGDLSGIALGGVAVLDNLVLTGGDGNVVLRLSVVGSSLSAITPAIPVPSPDSGDDDEGGGCTGRSGSGGLMLLLLALGLMGIAGRRVVSRR